MAEEQPAPGIHSPRETFTHILKGFIMNREFSTALAKAVASNMKAQEDVRNMLKRLTMDIGDTDIGDVEEVREYSEALTEAGRSARSDIGIARFAFRVIRKHKKMVNHSGLYSKGMMTACNNAATALGSTPEKVVGLALKKFGAEFTATEVKKEWPLVRDPKSAIESAIQTIEKHLPMVSEDDAKMLRETLACI